MSIEEKIEQAKIYWMETICSNETLCKMFRINANDAKIATDRGLAEFGNRARTKIAAENYNSEEEIKGMDHTYNPERSIQHINIVYTQTNNL